MHCVRFAANGNGNGPRDQRLVLPIRSERLPPASPMMEWMGSAMQCSIALRRSAVLLPQNVSKEMRSLRVDSH